MERPLFENESQDNELRLQFNNLRRAICGPIDWNRAEEELIAHCEALNERIRVEVTERPELANIVSKNDHTGLSS